jgi:phage shock protein A
LRKGETTMAHGFRELDDLVLELKGLVLARELLRRRGAGEQQIGVHEAAIERVREQLARAARDTGALHPVAA